MVEALLSRNVALCLPELLQDAVVMCQTRERELNSYRTSGVPPAYLIERIKREMHNYGANPDGSAPPSLRMAPGSFKPGSSINSAGSSSPTTVPSSASGPISVPGGVDYGNILREELDNRIAIVLMLLNAHIRIPYNTKPAWLPYLRSHAAFKHHLDTMARDAAHTFDLVRTAEFTNMTRVELIGQCIDDDRAVFIAKHLIGMTGSAVPLLHLNLSRNWIEQRGATELGNALGRNSTLLSINLAQNYIQDCTHMMKGMRDNKTLKSLDLSANRLSTGEAIATRLPTLRLTSLNLAMNKLEYRGGSQILKAVLGNPTLELQPEVDPLAFNSSGRSFLSGAEQGVRGTSSSGSPQSSAPAPTRKGSSGNLETVDNTPISTLTSLNLSSNEIHPYDRLLFSDDLVEGLKNNTTLTELDLSFNWLGNQDLTRVVGSLSHNVTLARLIIRGYAVPESDLKAWLSALSLNYSLTNFDFDHSPPSDTRDTIRRHVAKNNIAFSNSPLVQDSLVNDTLPDVERKSSSKDMQSSRSQVHDSATATKQYGIVRVGDSKFDALDEQSLPRFETRNARGSAPPAASAPSASSTAPTLSPARSSEPATKPSADTAAKISTSASSDQSASNGEPEYGDAIEVHSQGRELFYFPRSALFYTGVTKLVLQRNNLASVPRAINLLVNLAVLDLRCNRLAALPPELGDLDHLSHLLLSHNKLQFIPVQLTRQASLKYVLLASNPLSLVPPNFRKGVDALWKKPFQQSEFYQYLKTIGSSGEGTFNKGRLMLVGDPAVGKTTIRKMLVRGKVGFSLLDWFGSRSSSTPAPADISVATDGIDIDIVKMTDPGDGTKYLWDVWDYAGHEVYYTTHTFFLSPRAVYLLVFNMEQYSRLSIEYWMQSILFKAGTEAPIFLVGTHPERLTTEERTSLLAQLKSNYRGIFVDLVWINAVTGEGVEELKGKICKIAAKRRLVGETVPISYMRIADQLRATAQARPYMPMKELAGIVLSNDVSAESVDAAVSWLIDVGAVLSYATSNRNAPEQLVFIDPQFLCNMFAQVVSIKYSSTTGRLSRGIIASICRQDAKLQEELFHILTVFDLAYILKRASSGPSTSSALSLPSSTSTAPESNNDASNQAAPSSSQFDSDVELFVPALLSLTEPKNLAEIWRPSPALRLFERHFTFPFLPLGFFSKLLVRCLLLPGVEARTYWANGIVAVQTKHGLTLASLPSAIVTSDAPAETQPEVEPVDSLINSYELIPIPSKAEKSDDGPHEEDEMFYLRFEPEKNLLMMKVSGDQDGVTLASLVDLVLALIQERYPQAEFSMTIPVSTSEDETVYLEVDELASNIATGQYVKVIDGKVWDISMFAPDLVLKDLSNLRVNDSDIIKGRRLGVGSFGEVFDATYHGEQCAVKYITRFRQLANESDFFRTRSSDFANFAHEIRIMNLLKHPNIVRMKGFIPQPVGLLMEFFGSGDLVGLLERAPQTPWPLRLRIALDVALGMNYLHMLEPPLCHRDLRSPNVLLKSTQADSPDPVAKVADFGLTVAVVDRLGYGPTESWRWSAPEVVTAEQYTHRSDIWSYGILILELIFAELPYDTLQKSLNKREDEMSRLYTAGGFRPEFPDSYDSHAVAPADEKEHAALKLFSQLGRDCCMEKPEDRLPFAQIVTRLIEIIDSMGTLELPESVRKTAVSDYYLEEDDETFDDGEEAASPHTATDDSPSKTGANSPSLGKSASADGMSSVSNSGELGLRKSVTFSMHSSAAIPQSAAFVPDNSKEFILADRKAPATISTTAALAIKNQLWVGLSDGTLQNWDLSAITMKLGDVLPQGTAVDGDKVQFTSTSKPIHTHASSIQSIITNDTQSKICAISEDGWFTLVDMKTGATSKFQAVPAQTAPLLCALSIGERLYIGNSRGHVVAWSWESTALLAFWDGMDAQPVCQLFYTRGTRDLVVAYGSSIKFLNVFDLGDSLRHWRPQVASTDPSRSKMILARSRSATVEHSDVHIAVEEHRKLAASAHGPPSNAALFRSVAQFQHSAFIGFAGQHIWTKSGSAIRLWTTGRSKNTTSSGGGSFTPSSSSSALASSSGNDKWKTGSLSSPEQARATGTSRSNPFTSTISLHKELRSPNPESSADLLVTPTIMTMSINTNSHKKAANVFILESPHRITQWDAYASSYTANLDQHDTNPVIERIAVLGDCLIAVYRDRVFVWRAPQAPSSAQPSSLSSSLTSSNALVVPPTQASSSSPSAE